VGIEIAVGTFAHAPRKMQVERQRGQRAQIEDAGLEVSLYNTRRSGLVRWRIVGLDGNHSDKATTSWRNACPRCEC